MLVAVATIISHNSIAHHHHEDMKPFVQHDLQHHHDNTSHDHDNHNEGDSQHNIFSFAQLDEDYLPTKYQKVSIEVPILYLLTPLITFKLHQLHENTKTHFGYYREFPPPAWSSSNHFSRPPPAC
jgi:hypothetical protein